MGNLGTSVSTSWWIQSFYILSVSISAIIVVPSKELTLQKLICKISKDMLVSFCFSGRSFQSDRSHCDLSKTITALISLHSHFTAGKIRHSFILYVLTGQ